MLKSQESDFIRPLVSKMDLISVREDSGVDVVEKLTGRSEAASVLDPTLLLDKNQWNLVANHNHAGKQKKYILCYLMQSRKNDRMALDYAKRISREAGLPIIKICRG